MHLFPSCCFHVGILGTEMAFIKFPFSLDFGFWSYDLDCLELEHMDNWIIYVGSKEHLQFDI